MKTAKIEVLATKKIKIISLFYRKIQAASKVRVGKLIQNKFRKWYIPDELDTCISITKSEDFYKTHNIYPTNPFKDMNK